MITDLQEYLKPNPYLREPRPCPEIWAPPEPSQGLRAVPLRGRGSSHGHIVLDDRWIDFESRLERNAALAFLARPDTAHLVEQTPRVVYRGDDGDWHEHEHVFDFLVTRTDRTKVAVFVKPSALFRPAHRRMLGLIAAQMSPEVAQKILPVTEKKFSRADLYNAELIQEVRRDPDPDDDAVIAGLVAGMTGPVKIDDLVQASGLDGYAFRAVVRAIARCELRLTKLGKITHSAIVERAKG